MGAGGELPAYLGWVFGGAIFFLAAVAFGALVLAAARELRASDYPQPSPWRPRANPRAQPHAAGESSTHLRATEPRRRVHSMGQTRDWDITPMHGEYKVPGGKLVIADLVIRDGRFADVVINGDFFLEPPEALLDIAAAIEDLPADSSEAAIAEQIRDTLAPEVTMVGFSPEAVARAVRRAVDESS